MISNGSSLPEAFLAQADAFPDRIAITSGDRHYRYGELSEAAAGVVQGLREAGVRPGGYVGLSADRGFDFVSGMLGILMFGSAYVPLAPGLPAVRAELMIRDCDITHVVTGDGGSHDVLRGIGVKTLAMDELPRTPSFAEFKAPAPDDVAYVIYTSGSTGTPKGVPIEHRQVISLFEATGGLYGFGEDDVWTQFHSVGFDFSVWEIWGALLHGGRLVVVPKTMARYPEEFRRLLVRERVTVLSQTPSAFRQLVAADARRDSASEYALRLVVFGGERLDVGTLRPWLDRYGDGDPLLVNMYGITETCVHVTYRTIIAADLGDTTKSPIGRPLPGVEVHVLDRSGAAVPDGTPGDLHVGGTGVGRGYLARPELTARRFVTRNVSGPGGTPTRLYDSGDRVVRDPDGELFYLGRNDDQLSVLGHRIEPQEVEICLAAHPSVTAAVVFPFDHGEGDVRLTAHIVLAPDALGRAGVLDALAAHAAARLPEHLRPADLVLVEDLFMTTQGKTDRRAHAEAHTSLNSGGPTTTASLIAEAVSTIVTEVLCRELKDRDVDFFDAGVKSLSFVRIITKVNAHYGTDLTGSELDGTASINRIAEVVDQYLEKS